VIVFGNRKSLASMHNFYIPQKRSSIVFPRVLLYFSINTLIEIESIHKFKRIERKNTPEVLEKEMWLGHVSMVKNVHLRGKQRRT
jgi:hypothetical protein